MALFSKVLVANRGEIAVRIFRTLRELGIGAVAVYSEADRDALHVRAADEAFLVGPGPAAESYLVGERIVETAQRAGVEAIHPGYGFLAENAAFARAVEDSGLAWIGPPSAAIELMGSKTRARTAMRAAGVPIIPGATDPVETVAEVLRLGEEVGYPLIVKAAAGGGGKGMKLVAAPAEAERAFESAQREGEKYFADGRVYVERYLEDPRHVEVQVLADGHGNVIHLGERDCTIQRRHQKLIEETPSPAVDEALRERIGRIAVDAARAAGYRSAGTIEGLLTPAGDYYFMEMNTRIQVEHTVTEEVTGIDLVREQVRIAAGEPLSLRQEDVRLRGHAIECRINAEDVASGFLPAPGRLTTYREPGGPGVRVDSGVVEGTEITGLYDPMIAKLIVHGVDREHARMRMLRALDEFEIGGPPTLLGFHRALLATRASSPARPATASSSRRSSPPQAAGADEGDRRSERLPRRTAGCARGRRRWRSAGGASTSRVLEPEPPWAELARRRRERAAQRARRRRQRGGRQPDAGNGAEGGGDRGRAGRGGPRALRGRGDEDGERDRRPPVGHRRASSRSRRATPSRAGR